MKLPNLITDLDVNLYHKWDGHLSKTTLALIQDTPARFKAHCEGWLPKKEKDHFRIGNAAHMMALEPHLFEKAFHIIPSDMVKNAAHAKYKAELEKAAGRVVLKEHELQDVARMGMAMREHPIAGPLLQDMLVEASIYWERESGTKLKQRPDLLSISNRRIVDIKTAESADPESFFKAGYDLLYDVSAALGAEAFEAVAGEPLEEYLFLVVEKKPPHFISVFSAMQAFDKDGLTYAKHGAYRLQKTIDTYEMCASEDHWPEYVESIIPMMVPDFKMRSLARELDKELE